MKIRLHIDWDIYRKGTVVDAPDDVAQKLIDRAKASLAEDPAPPTVTIETAEATAPAAAENSATIVTKPRRAKR